MLLAREVVKKVAPAFRGGKNRGRDSGGGRPEPLSFYPVHDCRSKAVVIWCRHGECLGYTPAGVVLSRNAHRHRKGEHMAKAISTRDYFAAAALTGILASTGGPSGDSAPDTDYEHHAKWAYKHADAMLVARGEQNPD